MTIELTKVFDRFYNLSFKNLSMFKVIPASEPESPVFF